MGGASSAKPGHAFMFEVISWTRSRCFFVVFRALQWAHCTEGRAAERHTAFVWYRQLTCPVSSGSCDDHLAARPYLDPRLAMRLSQSDGQEHTFRQPCEVCARMQTQSSLSGRRA